MLFSASSVFSTIYFVQ
uniref:Uncharacterized protein n=1 Tax=Anguilla anguilla TaxID=7936 RepID=A0A0E9PH56_ANGAN